jgi:hypothetical protein
VKWGAVVVLVLTGLGWFFQGNDFFMYKFFAPRTEQVRRETYEQTKSYKQGSVQRLSTLCTQVADADEGHKGMLNDIIAHEFVEWDMADVPQHLRGCLATARVK